VRPKILFTPSAQIPDPLSLARRYVIRASTSPAETIAAVSSTVAAFDSTATIRYSMLDTQVVEAMLQERLMARLSAIFGGVALLLAIVGLYGVVSYSVASRRAEIGVRVALGASRGEITRMVLRQGIRVTALGLVIGLALAAGAAQVLAGQLMGLPPLDPVSFVVMTALLGAVATAAAAIPARRAARLDPLRALRHD
jgi:ABC-type antimicrobial peptide transport system permease subunit